MPIYDFKCSKCGEIFEAFVSSPNNKPKCPVCGSEDTEKLFSPPSLIRGETLASSEKTGRGLGRRISGGRGLRRGGGRGLGRL